MEREYWRGQRLQGTYVLYLLTGLALGEVVGVLGAAGITGPVGAAATSTIIIIVAVEIGWMDISNDGHGVVIDIVIPNDYVDPNPSNIPYHYIQGQEHV